jgi:hypothetical protein
MLLNRVFIRYYYEIFPESWINSDAFSNIIQPSFSVGVMIFTMYATWQIFTLKGVSSLMSGVNAVASPFFWPLIMLPQMLYIERRRSKSMLSGKYS